MRATLKQLIAAITVAALTLTSGAVASAQEPVLVPETETLFIAAGCPQDTPGTCTSVRWLGRVAGDATSNYLTATTPVDEVLYHVEGQPNWRDYPSDDTLREGGYLLRTDEDITATVTLSANVIAALDTVHARIDAVTTDNKFITLGPLEESVTVLPLSEEQVEFAFDIAELDGVTLRSLTFQVAVHGVNAQGGYIDQQGGSTVEIPYWVEEVAAQ